MITDMAYYQIMGKPLILYLGILVFLSLIATATVMVLTMKGIRRFPVQTHHKLAFLTIALAVIHATLGILYYF